MIIDFHTHIFPKEIRNNRDSLFKNEPEFKLLYESPKSKNSFKYSLDFGLVTP